MRFLNTYIAVYTVSNCMLAYCALNQKPLILQWSFLAIGLLCGFNIAKHLLTKGGSK